MSKFRVRLLVTALATGVVAQVWPSQADAQLQTTPFTSFTAGDIVVSVEGNGSSTGGGTPYGDNQAAPLTLYEYGVSGTSSATGAGLMTLPQTQSGANFPISGEYGSSSEGTLQLSGNGYYLTIAGYGVNANTFNASPGTFSLSPTNTALGQSGSLTGQSYTPVPRVIAAIGENGSVNSTTALYNVFNANNPRSVYTVNGSSFYVSGQGTSGDNTGGVFYTTLGSTSATSITGNDAGVNESQDTRDVQIVNGTLYVSSDSKAGATNRDYIGTLGTAGTPPTTVANGGNGPAMLPGFGNNGGTGRVTITAATTNGINSAGQVINLSPENFFFANATTLYVADSGSPKNTSEQNVTGGSPLGDGGLQKWSFLDGSWSLDYTLSAGLNLVPNTDTDGSTGLYGLTGEEVTVDGVQEVELYATNYTIADLDPTFLYGITDVLDDTSNPGNESFSELAAAPADSNFKGVAFAPAPEPASLTLLATGLAGLAARRRRGRG